MPGRPVPTTLAFCPTALCHLCISCSPVPVAASAFIWCALLAPHAHAVLASEAVVRLRAWWLFLWQEVLVFYFRFLGGPYWWNQDLIPTPASPPGEAFAVIVQSGGVRKFSTGSLSYALD